MPFAELGWDEGQAQCAVDVLLGLGRDDAFTPQQARIRQLEALRVCDLLQLLKVLARAGRKEQGGPVSLLIGEPKPDLAVELDSACRPRFRRLRHDRQLGNQLTASAVIPGKHDALQLRMRSAQIDFGCFEELARVMYQPQPSGSSEKLDPGQDLRLEPRSKTFAVLKRPSRQALSRSARLSIPSTW